MVKHTSEKKQGIDLISTAVATPERPTISVFYFLELRPKNHFAHDMRIVNMEWSIMSMREREVSRIAANKVTCACIGAFKYRGWRSYYWLRD
jgi:hypothetical protein